MTSTEQSPTPSTPTTHHTPILILGSGSAGLCAATWLARSNVPCTILERRSGPLEIGQADGVAVRTVEVFESFGIEHGLVNEGYWVNEVAFWDVDDLPDPETVPNGVNGAGKGSERKKRGLVRTSRTPDIEPGLSHLPHVILNQARLNSLMLEEMRRANGQSVEYGWAVKDVQIDESVSPNDRAAYPVTVMAEKDGVLHTWKTKYALVSHIDIASANF